MSDSEDPVTVVITASDLEIIENALRNMAEECRQSSKETRIGRVRTAFLRSSKEYVALADKLAEADEIKVDL